jgi:hypothetical protein
VPHTPASSVVCACVAATSQPWLLPEMPWWQQAMQVPPQEAWAAADYPAHASSSQAAASPSQQTVSPGVHVPACMACNACLPSMSADFKIHVSGWQQRCQCGVPLGGGMQSPTQRIKNCVQACCCGPDSRSAYSCCAAVPNMLRPRRSQQDAQRQHHSSSARRQPNLLAGTLPTLTGTLTAAQPPCRAAQPAAQQRLHIPGWLRHACCCMRPDHCIRLR